MKKILVIISLMFVVVPALALAQDPTEYTLLEPLPFVTENGSTTNAARYIEGIFQLTIGIAGVLAVLAIIFGGIKYMSTDAFSGKEEAKGTINNAIWGLALAMGAWLILYTINPNLTTFNLQLDRQNIPSPSGSTGSGSGSGLTPGSGPGHLQLSQQQAMQQFSNAGIAVAGAINLAGVRQIVVDEIVSLKTRCNCEVTVTSATGGEHASGACSHANGYKVDLRSNGSGAALTTHITTNNSYTRLPDRSDGARVYRAPSGALYALESNHWDIVRCQ